MVQMAKVRFANSERTVTRILEEMEWGETVLLVRADRPQANRGSIVTRWSTDFEVRLVEQVIVENEDGSVQIPVCELTDGLEVVLSD